MEKNYWKDKEEKTQKLLDNIKKNMKLLEDLLKVVNEHWAYEDCVYRFYHNSFKVYYIQEYTIKIIEILKKIAPKDITFNSDFEQIFKEGTGKVFKMSHNKAWLKHTRPMLEALFHAKYFLEMIIRYGKEFDRIPEVLPSGWAAVLELYGLR